MWEIVSAVATALTGIIILVTVVLGSHQLRVTNRQLEQLQRATQLEGTMKIFEDFAARSSKKRGASCQPTSSSE
jgi:hypothetical protein